MAKGIKLTESVSISELMHMREVEGLSNAEIAKRIGCALHTVIAHIGKQPVEMTKRNQMAGLRRAYSLPPLTETKAEIPDMPRESFKERCERLMNKAEESPTPVVDLMAKTDEKKSDVAEKNRSKRAELRAIESDLPILTGEARDEAIRNAQRLMKEIAELGKLQTEAAPKEADKAREAHCKALDTVAQLSHGIVQVIVHGTVYDIPKVAYEKIKHEVLKNNAPVQKASCSEELHALVEELKVMFSPLSVLDYLKCKLYELGTPHIIYADRDDYLTEIHRLLAMQEGVAQHD